MSKKIISILLAVVMILSMATVAIVSVSAADDGATKTYYFLMPESWYTNSSITGAGIYWWAPTEPALWPGQAATKADTDDVFKMEVPSDVTTIIWNNFFDGGEDKTAPEYTQAVQTTNIGSEYYDAGESELYPDGVESFDGMIYVVDESKTQENEYNGKLTYVGEWYYYYGNGEYGTTPEPTDVEPTTAASTVNGQTVHVGDVVNFTATLTTDKALENIQAVLNYDSSMLKLTTTEKKQLFPVIAEVGGLVFNTGLDNMIKFNASDIGDGYDFTNGGTLVYASFEVIGEGDSDIYLDIEEMNANGYTYVAKSEMVNPYTLDENADVIHNDPEPETTAPTTTVVPATTAGTTTAATTVASDDQVPTTTPGAGSSTDGGSGSVSTGDVSFAVALLVLLISATGVMFVVRKKIEG